MTQTEALRMALEAFEWNYNTDLDNIPACEKWAKMLKENITAIKEALANVDTNDTSQESVDETAKQRHEPVAWMEMVVANLVREGVNKHKARELAQHFYTSPPPQRKPLTDEQISSLWDGHTVPVFGKTGINPIVFARAIEAAHNIKE